MPPVRQLCASNPAVPGGSLLPAVLLDASWTERGRREARGNHQQEEEGASPSPSARLTGTAGIVSAVVGA